MVKPGALEKKRGKQFRVSARSDMGSSHSDTFINPQNK
jgi:hypothetical protein